MPGEATDGGAISVITISASGVVSTALAKTGVVLLFTIPSKAFTPRADDLIKMLKNDPPNLTPQNAAQVVFKRFSGVERFRSAGTCTDSPFTERTCIGSLPSFE